MLARRVAIHAALADPARLRIIDTLTLGDASASELAAMLGMASNLVAHHLNTLDRVGLISRTRSEGDRRRHYLRLLPAGLNAVAAAPVPAPRRVLFVCTANSARSQLAAALWRQASHVPAASAGTHPAERIEPGAIAAAERHRLPLRRLRPRHLDQVAAHGDLIITVCDRAHEELDHDAAGSRASGRRPGVHWSVPDPVPVGTAHAFDQALAQLAYRVDTFAGRFAS